MKTVIVGGSAIPGWKAVRSSCSARSAVEDIAVRLLSHLGRTGFSTADTRPGSRAFSPSIANPKLSSCYQRHGGSAAENGGDCMTVIMQSA